MKYLTALLLPFLASIALAFPALAFNPLPPEICTGDAKYSPTCRLPQQTQNPVVHILSVAIAIMSILVGVFAVIMIIIGGLTMVTSAGNSEKIAKARARIVYSLVALVIAALAWTIVTFVVNHITT